jgi:hypothetical protein
MMSSTFLMGLILLYLALACSAQAAPWAQESPALPAALGEVSAAYIGGKLYVLGQGFNSTCSITLQPRSAWDCSLAVRPAPGDHHAAVTPGDGTLWLVGGLNGAPTGINPNGKVWMRTYVRYLPIRCKYTPWPRTRGCSSPSPPHIAPAAPWLRSMLPA